jgi:hypothetical protein
LDLRELGDTALFATATGTQGACFQPSQSDAELLIRPQLENVRHGRATRSPPADIRVGFLREADMALPRARPRHAGTDRKKPVVIF